MASSFLEAPASLRLRQVSEPRNSRPLAANPNHHQALLSFSINDIDLSCVHSQAGSSPVQHVGTPSGSNATMGLYQSSDISDLDDDPFFGANIGNIDPATASCLDGAAWDPDAFSANNLSTPDLGSEVGNGFAYPLTPTHTAPMHASSPTCDLKDLGLAATSSTEVIPTSVSPQQLQKPFSSHSAFVNSSAITPSHSGSNRTSEEGLAPAFVALHPQSPRVTVSVWDKDNDAPLHTVERTLENSPRTLRSSYHSAGDLICAARHGIQVSGPRNCLHRSPQSSAGSGRAGLDPASRCSGQVSSINQIASQREMEQRNQQVGRWLSHNLDHVAIPLEKSAQEILAIDSPRDDDNDIPLGDQTENRYVPGHTYFEGAGGEITLVDRQIIASNRNWADAPMIHGIQPAESGRFQPESSQAAIARFEMLCRDNDSILSRSATWGTRRRSFPSVLDAEGVTSGNFLKKLSISRGNGEKPSRSSSFFKDLRGLVTRTGGNQLRKRSRSRSRGLSIGGQDENTTCLEEPINPAKRDSGPHLSPPLEPAVAGKKPTPSINTTLVSMGQNFASMLTSHSRSGSVSGTSPIASPRASLGGLGVRNSLRRPRSKSEIPKPTAGRPTMESTSSLVDMWRKSGGPPVAPVSRVSHAPAAGDDEDEDEDDELYEDNDMTANCGMIDDITPDLAGFRQHVLALNPGMETANGYLVDRIAHQQIARYKHLLKARAEHLGLGSLCMALGGSANMLDLNGDAKGFDPLSAGMDDVGDLHAEVAISQENFPQDIPMPPTQSLPAVFECHLCFQKKKVRKPSQWTKHVHEDVQPFTCTWDKCRDPKIFKRKADWVRHENEGHRHLEWWTCDVDDCRHTCYRKDNFLQHLVREHKFLEPAVKTKAAMKRAGGMDPTWQKVEKCHVETADRPQDEPCRFCGETFPTWKKLTVHLAKHMEQISLPVLRLVAARAKELAADTNISPVQDPAARQNNPLPLQSSATTAAAQLLGGHLTQQQQQRHDYNQQDLGLHSPSQLMYPAMPLGQFQQPHFYPQQFESLGQGMQYSDVSIGQLNQGHDANQRLHGVSSNEEGTYSPSGHGLVNVPESDVEPFPQLTLSAPGLPDVGAMPIRGQLGVQAGYGTMLDPSSVDGSPFSEHESLSTYSRSPRQDTSSNSSGWQQQQHLWNERHLYM
ncbi:hypothetical protein UVI_02020180 [Ustilaginoidea virens]|uniref:C2H2-type domain-containing protein n=1 Tax=Ustilaginoidea virens TaxID=1159556 RepID=A0A1B5L3M2_USTVR|nr:hypothetical protein UVI_02020180 [Ustilaginoidea virens]